MSAVLQAVNPALTNDMRAYLGAREMANAFLFDTIVMFRRRYNLTAEAAGVLLAQWIKETT